MDTNNILTVIDQIIEDNIDSTTLSYKEPTRESLVKIVKSLETLGYETKGKSKEEVTQLIEDLTKQSNALDNSKKKSIEDIMYLFVGAYPRLYEESINEKNKNLQAEIETNNAKKTEVLEKLWSLQEESSEMLSDHIDANYIDELLQDQKLHGKSKQQLTNIKKLVLANSNSKLNRDRLTVKNGFVVVDGFVLPTQVTEQTYADMSAENSKKLYPDYTIALLNFTAELTGKTFDRGTLNRQNLTDRSLSYDDMFKILRTDNNTSILQSLGMIMGKVNEYQYIFMGIDSNRYVIYADLRPDYIRFRCDITRSDGDDCLVPSQIGG